MMAFQSKCIPLKMFLLVGVSSYEVCGTNANVLNCTEGKAFNAACESGCNFGYVACNQFGDNCRSEMQSVCMSKCNINAAEKCIDSTPDKSNGGCEEPHTGANIEGGAWVVVISFMAYIIKRVGGAKFHNQVYDDDTNEMNRSTGYSLVDQDVEEPNMPVTGEETSGITSTNSNIPSTIATRPPIRDAVWSIMTSTINSSVTSERDDIDHAIHMAGQEMG